MSDPAQAGEIFISYSSKDRERVRILVDALVRQGVTVWWDQHIVAGQNWENEIEKALHRSRAVIVLWSQHSVASDEVKEEANYARSQGKLIPVRLDGTLIPFRYLRTQTPDLSSWDGAEDHPVFHELLAAVAGRPVPERVRGGPDKASRRASRISRAWLVLPALLIGVIAAGLAGLMLRRTPSEVQAGVARVSVDPKLGRQPGTAFVVAVSGQTAFLVTCAHVVVEESSPRVEFRAAPLREFRATVRAREPGDNPRGLALLEVQNVPHEVQALPLAASANPVQGERLSVAGFSGPSSRFLILDMILAGDEGQDLTLSRETEAGFSGGPVLRGDSAIGIIYGREAGGYGTALISDVVRAYLRGLKVPLDGGPRTTQPSAQPPAAPQPGDTRVNPVSGLKDVWIPPGTFTMGCSEGDTECRESEKPGHPVTITKGFWMGQTEVTVGAYKRYVIATGKSMPPEPAFLGTAFNPGWEDMAQPILNVSFQEAAAYCAWAGRMSPPTEAQWEYAARAGSREARYGRIEDIAWYKDNSGDRPKGVGEKTPNAWKLYDMLGNAWEWTADWYGETYYQAKESRDPQGPPRGTYRGLRGGAWFVSRESIRVSVRGSNPPEDRHLTFGFRCAGD